MRIIGIDPGTITCGYGIIELVRKETNPPLPPFTKGGRGGINSKLIYIAAGDIKLNKKSPFPDRLKTLHDSLSTVINEYKPSQLCLEKIFYHKSIRSAFALGSTRGITLLLAAENNLPVFEYNSTELKMALTGYGRAEKRQVQEMVRIILNLNSSYQKFSEDSTDALALCICHIHSTALKL